MFTTGSIRDLATILATTPVAFPSLVSRIVAMSLLYCTRENCRVIIVTKPDCSFSWVAKRRDREDSNAATSNEHVVHLLQVIITIHSRLRAEDLDVDFHSQDKNKTLIIPTPCKARFGSMHSSHKSSEFRVQAGLDLQF